MLSTVMLLTSFGASDFWDRYDARFGPGVSFPRARPWPSGNGFSPLTSGPRRRRRTSSSRGRNDKDLRNALPDPRWPSGEAKSRSLKSLSAPRTSLAAGFLPVASGHAQTHPEITLYLLAAQGATEARAQGLDVSLVIWRSGLAPPPSSSSREARRGGFRGRGARRCWGLRGRKDRTGRALRRRGRARRRADSLAVHWAAPSIDAHFRYSFKAPCGGRLVNVWMARFVGLGRRREALLGP